MDKQFLNQERFYINYLSEFFSKDAELFFFKDIFLILSEIFFLLAPINKPLKKAPEDKVVKMELNNINLIKRLFISNMIIYNS